MSEIEIETDTLGIVESGDGLGAGKNSFRGWVEGERNKRFRFNFAKIIQDGAEGEGDVLGGVGGEVIGLVLVILIMPAVTRADEVVNLFEFDKVMVDVGGVDKKRAKAKRRGKVAIGDKRVNDGLRFVVKKYL